MKRANGKTWSFIGISAIALVAQSICITPFSFAEDGVFSMPSLGGSNFGQILPRGPFQDYKLDSQTSEPAAADPVSIYEKEAQAPPYSESLREQLNRTGPAGAGTPQSTAPVSKTNAWYKFLDPSLNLTRTLEESERKNILPIVPIPPSISKNGKGSEYVHTVILRADAKAEYGAFKTGFGSLFGRSGSIIMVTSTGKATRIFNVNGYERDVLFKLSNGQIIAIGPGSEMMISKNLNANELNANDGIARRGFTRTMRCAELNMAFAQYSLPSLLEVPEFRFFQKNQDPKVSASLQKTADALDSMRGNEGFHKVLSQQEQLVKRQKSKEHDQAESRQAPSNRLGNAAVIAQTIKPSNASTAALSKNNSMSTAERNAIELKMAAAEKLAAAKKLAERKAVEKRAAAAKIAEAEKKAQSEKIAAAERKAAAKIAQAETEKAAPSEKIKLVEKQSKPNTKLQHLESEKSEKTALLSRFSLKGLRGNNEKNNSDQVAISKADKPKEVRAKVTNLVSKLKPAEDNEDAASIVPSNLPADTRELLILAEKNEKQAKDLRVKAAKNKEFSEAYYLSAEQRLHLYKTFKKQMKKASELELTAREARDKAAIAGNTNHSTQ